MPEPEDLAPHGLHLPDGDPAAPAVEALRAMAAQGPVAASAELAAFLDAPTGQGLGTTSPSTTSPHRSDLVTVVRLPLRRAGRVAVAVGAALALAAIGGVAVAATGGTPDREPAQVQQDDPSDTTTTTTSTETETSTTATDDDQGDDQGDEQGQDQGDDQGDAGPTTTATHTANPVASANHHDGKGSDDEHADVNGGGVVDHHKEHSTAAHPTGGDDQSDDQSDDQGEDQGGDDQGGDHGDGGSSHGGGGKHGG